MSKFFIYISFIKYDGGTAYSRKVKLYFFREIIKNIPYRSLLVERSENKQTVYEKERK